MPQAETIKMYQCAGYQNVAEHARKGIKFPIHTSDYPAEHAHAVLGYTHARNESLDQLVEDLKEAAGVDTLRYELR